MQNRTVLLVDDTKALADLYAEALEAEGFSVMVAGSGAAMIDLLENAGFTPALVVLDIKLPDIDGLDLLERLGSMGIEVPAIVMTGYGTIPIAVEAMKRGAFDFLVKPFPIDRLCESAQRAMGAPSVTVKAKFGSYDTGLADLAAAPESETNLRYNGPEKRAGFGRFVGLSLPMQAVYDVVQSAAPSMASVFITGESGTGKEICAEAIHALSPRKSGPFIAVNCAAIPRDLLESELFGHVKGAFTGAHADREGAVTQAQGGTLFLDEITELPPEMQTKLLRFLQNLTYRRVGSAREEKANVRIVCATNRDPMEEIRAGRLREDLYYRLHVIPVHMPPLRERPADIMDLSEYFLRLAAREERKSFREFSAEAERILLSHPWPGNVRQLQNVIRSIVVLHHDTPIIGPHMLASVLRQRDPQTRHLKAQVTAQPAPSWPLEDNNEHKTDIFEPLWKIERDAIERAISHCEGNIPRAAALLEISPSTIYRKKMAWEDAAAASSA